MNAILVFLQKYWPRFLIALAIAATALIIYNSVNAGWTLLYSYSQGSAIGGVVCIFVGGLSLVNSFGGFNMASFYFRRKRIEDRKEDLYEYTERKKEEHARDRLCFLPYVIIGVLFVIFSFIALAIVQS